MDARSASSSGFARLHAEARVLTGHSKGKPRLRRAESVFGTVPLGELQGPRPSDAALFVYGSGRDAADGTSQNPRGNSRGLAAYAKPGRVLRFASLG